jgi:YfiH family protein
MFINKLFDIKGAVAYFTSLSKLEGSEEVDTLEDLVLPKQTHTVNVGEVTAIGERFPETDALITRSDKFAVGVKTADCVPIVLYAPDIRAVAAVHAGWRGTIGGIVDNTVRRLTEIGADSKKMYAAFGPAVCQDCYEVDHELGKRFIDAGFSSCVEWKNDGERPLLDLVAVNTERLLRLGINENFIIKSGLCTKHSVSSSGERLFPSWRAKVGEDRRLITFVRLTENIAPVV